MPNRVLNFGSLNIDHVYFVDHFARSGETLACREYRTFVGGKGLNQSVALARAGASVYHAGKVGQDGQLLTGFLERNGVYTEYVQTVKGPSGHAVIQVTPQGENSIVIHGGANRQIKTEDIRRVLNNFGPGDYVLVQNEISCVGDVISLAKQNGLTVVFNPAPMTAEVKSYSLQDVDVMIVNEVEARDLAGEGSVEKNLAALCKRRTHMTVVLTRGEKGALAKRPGEEAISVQAPKVDVIDTTAAGDVFVGYFVAGWVNKKSFRSCLEWACRAAALSVTKKGAAESIPQLAPE